MTSSMKKCSHEYVSKNEETNMVVSIYRRIGGKYVYDGGSSGRTGVVKWLCLDCYKFIPEPDEKNFSRGNGTFLSGHRNS